MADSLLAEGNQIANQSEITMIRSLVKSVLVIPILALFAAYRMGWIEFLTISRVLAMLPGKLGRWWRTEWYRRTLASCGEGLYVDWMAAIRTPKTRVGRNVFIGTFCWIGWADIGDDVMLGGHITMLSGGHHHGFDRLDIPVARQSGRHSQVKIGNDVWVGNGAIIMADVAPGSVVGAGAVVNKTFGPFSILAGVPARVIRKRGQESAEPRVTRESQDIV
jgi:acetyltransferase-like isoleucine patch superfamily enzyme